MEGATAGLPHDAAEAASDSVGGAHDVALQLGGDAAIRLDNLANQLVRGRACPRWHRLAGGRGARRALIALASLPSRSQYRIDRFRRTAYQEWR